MKKRSDIEVLQKKVQKFCEDRDWDQFHGAKDLAIGLSTESNELLDIFRFKDSQQVEKLFKNIQKRSLIQDELADVFFFILRFSQKYKIDLKKACLSKMKKSAQKYPISKAKGSNKKYNEY